jgi:hypothetical protein
MFMYNHGTLVPVWEQFPNRRAFSHAINLPSSAVLLTHKSVICAFTVSKLAMSLTHKSVICTVSISLAVSFPSHFKQLHKSNIKY